MTLYHTKQSNSKTGNVLITLIWRHVCATVDTMDQQWILHFLCVCVCVCVCVALVSQHAMRTHRIILSFVAYPAVTYFFILSYKRHIKGVFWFSLQLLSNFFSTKNAAIYYYKCTLVVMQSTYYSCQIVIKLEFSGQIVENNQVSKLMRICPVRAELLCEDGWTDRHDEVNSRFSQFCEQLK
jgi:hypothetical protein